MERLAARIPKPRASLELCAGVLACSALAQGCTPKSSCTIAPSKVKANAPLAGVEG